MLAILDCSGQGSRSAAPFTDGFHLERPVGVDPGRNVGQPACATRLGQLA